MKRARLELALRKAKAHVFRQQFAGKHEQDKIDAKAWISEFADVLDHLERLEEDSKVKR